MSTTHPPSRHLNQASPLPAVLVVDDNPDDVLFFRLAWEKARLANSDQFVGSREETLDYLEGRGKFSDRTLFPLPSVVVLDMRLPDGNALDLVRWLRGHKHFSKLAVLILSGYAREEEVRQAYQSGASSFLLKPSNPCHLEKTVGLIQSCWLAQNSSPDAQRARVMYE